MHLKWNTMMSSLFGKRTHVSAQGHVKKVCQDETVPFSHLRNCINFQSESVILCDR